MNRPLWHPVGVLIATMAAVVALGMIAQRAGDRLDNGPAGPSAPARIVVVPTPAAPAVPDAS